MKIEAFIQELSENKIEFGKNVPMCNHTTFKIGGNADVLVRPKNMSELKTVLMLAKENGVPYFILGNGSNLLVSDLGVEGAVIDMQGICKINIADGKVICGSGAGLRSVCIAARDNGLTGLEFAYGIPGTVGGAFYMNAGAYGGEIADVAESAVCIDKDNNIVTVSRDDMKLGYRTSAFQTNGLIIVSVTMTLKRGDKTAVKEQMDDIFARRIAKQPLEYPSAGSTFKRPVGNYAGTLIEQSGLKGVSSGGAQVSEKHAGFIVNKGGATAADVLSLIENVQKTVKDKSGVDLEPEVLFVGRR